MAGQKESVFVGKTLDDAVRMGLDALRLSRAEVMITVIEEGSGGFLGLGARPYKVRVMPRPGGPPREPAAGGEREDRSRGGRSGRGRSERGGRRGEGRGGDRSREGRGEPARAESAGGDRGRGGRGEPARAGREEGRGGERGRGEPARAGREEGRGGDRNREGRGEPARAVREEGRGADRAREGRAEPMPGGRDEGRGGDRAPDDSGREVAAFGEGDGRRRRRGRRGGRGRGEGRPMIAEPMDAGAVAVAPEGARAEFREDGPREVIEIDRPSRGSREPRESRESSESREPRESRESSESSESRGPREVTEIDRPSRESREPRESRESSESREPRERSRRDERGDGGESRPTGPTLPAAELEARATRAADELLRAMGFEAKVSARADGDNVDVTAEVSQGEELLTGRKGEVRQALQHLLNLTVNRGEGMRYHLQLEINDFWQLREKELEDLARSMADDAVARGDEVLTEFLNAQERRIIHVTLREDARVKTFAIGDGLIKKLAVAPADHAEGSREPD